MIEIKSVRKAGGVDTETKLDGTGIDLLEEATAIVKSLYKGFGDSDKDLQEAFLAAISIYAIRAIRTVDFDADNIGGENLA